ncbi:MAG: nicotinate-nucleotide adenylyltransferase [candidate division FCPU426 bacterium]
MRIGVLGGTFDPIHIGHLRAAEEVAVRLELDRVWFVPAGRPPHRAHPQTAARHRLAMARLAVAGNPRFGCLDWEVRRPGVSYTVDTLERLAARWPRAERFLILGADQSLHLPSWHEPLRLVRYARLVIISRPGAAKTAVQRQVRRTFPPALRRACTFVPIPGLDVSSTLIRAGLRAGTGARYLLPEAVLRYIRRFRLYSQR